MAFEVVFRQLSEEHLQALPKFGCGRASLDGFLVEDAHNFHKYGLTHTTLVYVQGDDAIAGYFSLSSDAVKLSTFETGELGLPFDAEISYFPAVKITKFAVHTKYQRAGLGMQLVNAIQGLVYADGRSVATRLLTVDAVNKPDVVAFYTKAGFEECLAAKKELRQQQARETVLMFKDIYTEN